MDIYEEAVMRYLSAGGKRFVSHQYSIRFDQRKEWSCPDFIVIDFSDRTIYVAEVTTADNIDNIALKVRNKGSQWLTKLKESFDHNLREVVRNYEEWIVVFVRKEKVQSLIDKTKDIERVSVKALDDVLYPWKWTWDEENIPVIDLKRSSTG